MIRVTLIRDAPRCELHMAECIGRACHPAGSQRDPMHVLTLRRAKLTLPGHRLEWVSISRDHTLVRVITLNSCLPSRVDAVVSTAIEVVPPQADCHQSFPDINLSSPAWSLYE